MKHEPTVLQEVAIRFGGKLSSCEVYDGNVCSTRPVAGRPWELELLAGEPFSERLKLTYRGRTVVVLAGRAYVHVSTDRIFESPPFTINARQKAGFRSELAATVSVGGAQYSVFTEDGRVSSEQKSVLDRPELLLLLVGAGLQEEESLHFTKGEMGFYLKRDHADNGRIGAVIEQITALAEKAETVKQGPELELLPVQFHPIIPMIQKWAVPDDSEREDRLESASRIVLRSLVDEVSPYLGAIDSYLDSFGQDAPTEEAVLLGRLAECALEAKQRLNETQT